MARGLDGNTFIINDPGYWTRTTLDDVAYKDNGFTTYGYVSASNRLDQLLIGSDPPNLNVKINLSVVDAQGRVTGIPPGGTAPLEQIPNSVYYLEGPLEDLTGQNPETSTAQFVYISQPTDGTFRIEMSGEGPYTVVASGVTPDGQPTAGVIFSGVGGSPSTVNDVTIQYAAGQITNLAPYNVVVTPDPGAINENQSTTLTGSFNDADILDTHTVLIDWGDGKSDTLSVAANVLTFGKDHQYLDNLAGNAPYTINVTVTDKDGGTGSASTTVTVNNLPPVISSLSTSAMTPGVAAEGQTVTLAGTFTDAGVLDTHTATIDWGDGTSGAAAIEEAAGAGSLSGSHAYAAGGLYSVAVTLADNDGGTTSATTTAVISGAGVQDGVLQIVGTQGDDRVAVNMWSRNFIKVHASFLPKPGFEVFSAAGIQRIVILLGDGDDFATVSGGVSLTTVIDGGRGIDFLNGGGGSNILLGGDGFDMLIGGPRRDILIGGRGSDMLVGGPGDDILIAGRTTMDSDEAHLAPGFDQALLAVLAEWNQESPYKDRVGVLRSRIVALDDGMPDVLVGCAGQDWFFAALGRQDNRDRVLDRQCDEFVEPLG